jgi:ribosomal protein S12 methylthiotransferase accessory factor
MVAIAEAAERYSGMDIDGYPSDYLWKRAVDFPEPTIDVKRIAQCSAQEYAADGCPLVPFNDEAIIRWSPGTDLAQGIERWVPSAMAIYGLPRRAAAESFVLSISTGYAVHSDMHTALCAAICEVVERDAIEVLWQQCLPLPLVDPALYTDSCRRVLSWLGDRFQRMLLFDATTDIGVPTVYALTIASHDAKLMHSTGCATGRTLSHAAEKAVLENLIVITNRDSETAQTAERPVNADFQNFWAIDDGMRYMGLREHSSAFSFLASGCEDRTRQPCGELPADPEERLWWLVDALAEKGMQVIAVDRTTNELHAAGLTAYCVVIPDLQPMSLHPLARYRAHPRLYRAPVAMGYPSRPEKDLNPWPQPFA